jgi:hypothetical protein
LAAKAVSTGSIVSVTAVSVTAVSVTAALAAAAGAGFLAVDLVVDFVVGFLVGIENLPDCCRKRVELENGWNGSCAPLAKRRRPLSAACCGVLTRSLREASF